MNKKADEPNKAVELRRRAEELARDSSRGTESSLHELRVHQIELEVQNEELRRAQAELDAERARYFDIYNLAPVGYVTVSEQGLILEANLTVAVLLDLSRTELLKQPLPRFIRKEDADRYYLLSKQLIKTGTPQTCQLGMVRTDGVEFWACLDMNAAHGADGESFCLVAISDITAHKLAEDTLQQAHAVLELRVAERTDDLRKEIIERKQAEYQTKKRLKELQAFYSLAEIAEKEGITLDNLYQELADILPKSWQYPEIACARIVMGDIEFFTENFMESAWMLSAPVMVNRAIAGSLKVGYLEEKPKEDEGPFLKEERWLIDAIAERIGRITESKQEAEKLQKSEARLKAIFENSDQSFLVIDLNRKIQSFNKIANERTVKTFGKEIRPGDSIYEMVLPRDRDDFDRDFQHALNGDLVQTEKSFNVGAVELCYEFRYAPVRLDGQQVFGVFFSVTDITERKQMEVALRRNQSMLARTERIAQIGSWEWDVATDTVTWSDEMFRFFQRNPADGAPSFAEHPELYFPEDMQRLRDAVEATINNGAPYEIELRAIRKDGAVRVCLARGFAEMSPEKRATRLFGSLQDITERKRAEDTLLASEERYRSLFQQASDGIFYLSTDLKIIEINSSFARMHGYQLEGMQDMRLQDLDTPETFRLAPDRMRRAFAGEAINFEVEHYHKDGHVFPLEVSLGLIFVDGKNIIQAFHRDITVRKATEEKIRLLNLELEKLALTDYLTNLYNQRYFMQRGAEEFKRAQRHNQPLALMMLDIDEFKKINDTFGHGVGDLALQQVARILKSSLREIDLIGRMGGDEFAVLLPDTLLEDAVALAERARQAIANTSFYAHTGAGANTTADQILRKPLTISVGVATISDAMLRIDDLLRNADGAMYRAKHNGRNRVVSDQGNPSVPPEGGG